MSSAFVVASLVFLVSLAVIFTEKIQRTIVAVAGAAIMVIMGRIFEFYTEEQVLASVDLKTLGLLMGMMIIVALLEPTGFFEYMAVLAARLSRGQPVRLLVMLGVVTTLLSMFLDNVTTVVLIAPVTILICEILGLKPNAFLISEALLSNTGGVATLVGDPPNVIIGSEAGLGFNDFLTHSLPVVFIVWTIALLLLIRLFREELAVKPTNTDAVMNLDLNQSFNDPHTARQVLIVLGVAVVFFFLHGWLDISPAMIALSAAALAMLWVRPRVDELLRRVEWSVLVFFAALFIMVGGLEQAGVLHALVGLLERVAHIPPVWFGVAIIWVVAILSAVVDNVPITIALIPVILELGQAGMDVSALWWALAFGAGFGGNGTIIGSSANIVVASLSEKTRDPIGPTLWNRRGLPVMLVTCFVASILFVVLYPLMAR